MKEITVNEMTPNKNYLAVITVDGEKYYHTVSFLKYAGLCEYKPDLDCPICCGNCGDDWYCAEWMYNNDLKIFEVS